MSEGKKTGGHGPMGGGPGAMGNGEKAKDFKGSIKKLMYYLKPFIPAIVIVILFAIGSAAFSIIGPKILGNVTTDIFKGLVNKVKGSGNGIDFTSIQKTMLFLLVLYVIS